MKPQPSAASSSSSHPRPSYTSSTTKSSSFDGKRQPRLKESQFVLKHGLRHHGYDPEKAPYPLSYDRHVLELESLDNRLVKHLRNGSVSFVNFADERPPERTLDLGCGTGTWVVDAAREWPRCEFVGFDLMNIQIPLKILEPSEAQRISWVHGNFLTTKLPFEDDEFDHVHIQSIARGVSENKWGMVFEEVCRVLRPGGSLELIEDDIMFPSLPRWFTAPLRARPRRAMSAHFPDGSVRGGYPSPPNTPSDDTPSHDHALLESLYTSVFEHRFINMKPSALLPSYFTTYFRQVTLGPIISFPMPPVPPPQPLPPQIITTYALDPNSDILSTRSSTVLQSPSAISTVVRPTSLSFSSTVSAGTNSTAESSTYPPSLFSSATRTKSTSFSSTYEALDPTLLHATSVVRVPAIDEPQTSQFYCLDSSLTKSTGASKPPQLFPVEQLSSLNERSLAMHLYRSYQAVLACQEAIWEELKDRLRNRRDELKPFGWDDDEDLEELQNRKKFERLIDRYRSDMQTRVSFWCSLCDIGWKFPPREPLSKAELIEEERIREAMLEAKKYSPPEDLQVPSRSLRVLVGYKP